MKDGDEIAVIVLEDAVTDGEQWKLTLSVGTSDKVAATRMKDGDEIAVIVLEDAVTDGEQWKLSRLRRVRSPTRRQLTRE